MSFVSSTTLHLLRDAIAKDLGALRGMVILTRYRVTGDRLSLELTDCDRNRFTLNVELAEPLSVDRLCIPVQGPDGTLLQGERHTSVSIGASTDAFRSN